MKNVISIFAFVALLIGTLGGCSTDVPVRQNPVDGAAMVFVSQGEFPMGDDDDDIKIDNPSHTVRLSDYWIYKNLVTVAQYKKFCSATGHTMPPEPVYNGNHFNPLWSKEDHPIVNVTWDDAMAYAKWAKADLPTEAQWEKAARGTDGLAYPWGDNWDSSKCQCSSSSPGDSGGTAPVGTYPSGASPYGCLDMAGNVYQWCKDWYVQDYWESNRGTDPRGPESGTERVARGGSWVWAESKYSVLFRTAFRGRYPPSSLSDKNVAVGFRCVVNTPNNGG
jgi:sulfatase modifying factor 1